LEFPLVLDFIELEEFGNGGAMLARDADKVLTAFYDVGWCPIRCGRRFWFGRCGFRFGDGRFGSGWPGLHGRH